MGTEAHSRVNTLRPDPDRPSLSSQQVGRLASLVCFYLNFCLQWAHTSDAWIPLGEHHTDVSVEDMAPDAGLCAENDNE